jgi:uncharacterized membrane protein YeaQ/YmgE (transglycosylase-associated protein family)
MRFLMLAFALTLCGLIVAAIAALIAARIMEGRTTGLGHLAAVIGSMVVGYPVGVSTGVVATRYLAHWRGSVVRGILGAVLGAVFVIVAAEPLQLNVETDLLLLTYAACITIFATVGLMSRT